MERFALRNQWQLFNMGDPLRYIALDTEHEMHDVVIWHLSKGILMDQDVFVRGELSAM